MFTEELERKFRDFRELGLPPLIDREGVVHHAEQAVSTLIGARRAGKSYRAYQWGLEKLARKEIVSLEQICFVDFDNPILAQIQAKDLSLIQDTFLKLHPEFGLKTPLLFIFDEIHKIQGWENYVISLSQNRYWKVLVTGSSSKLLRDNVATELRGKSVSTNIYPLSFSESLRFHGFQHDPKSTKGRAEARRLFDSYLTWGCYPAVTKAEVHSRRALLSEYFDTMILKDILQRHNVSKTRQCLSLYHYLLSLMAKNYTLQSAYDFLKHQEYATSKDSIRNYIHWAEDAWFLFSVNLFSDSRRAQEKNYKKIYCIDWALAMQNSSAWDGSYSRAFENLVYLHLTRYNARVNYYLTRNKRQEIDFIVSGSRGKPEAAVQVCMNMDDPNTRKRELEPLISASRYFGIKDSFVVTMDEEQTIHEQGITIQVVPAWQWLLKT